MRKLIVLALVLMVAVYAVPAFANCGTCEGKSIFQKMSDCVKSCGTKGEVKPVEKVAVFQDLSNYIAEGSAEAKKESLRTPKNTVK